MKVEGLTFLHEGFEVIDVLLLLQVSSGTVVVNHAHDKPSLTFTASIEDYARKADPSCWEPAKFKKSQFVRVSPGT